MGFVRWDRAERDAEIRRLAAMGLSTRQIGARVGCANTTAWEVLNPEGKRRANARRRTHNTSPEGLQRQRDYRARKAFGPAE